MKEKINTLTKIAIEQPLCSIAYYPIDSNDYESIHFYENNGYTVKTILFNGNPRCFAFIPVETQEQAKCINQELNRLYLQEQDSYRLRMANEVSFNTLSAAKYESTATYNDPAAIFETLATIKALLHELDCLTDEEYHICQMIGSGMSDNEIAAELNLPCLTFHTRKIKLLKRLKHHLKEYR